MNLTKVVLLVDRSDLTSTQRAAEAVCSIHDDLRYSENPTVAIDADDKAEGSG
jgi:hypothetical protein